VIGVKRLACGNFSNCKMLRQGIFELKMYYGKGIRVYYIRRGIGAPDGI
jgi:putative addiction module killer protein